MSRCRLRWSVPELTPIVFVVDDDASLRRALARLLRTAGYASATYADARSYLARAPHDGPCCLILDLAMPEIDGLQLQAHLAQDAHAPPIIFLSGHGSIPDSVQAMKMGAVDFLTKPADREKLCAAVRTALARHAALTSARGEEAARQSRLAKLSTREQEILHYVVAGLRNKQIAARLAITEKTVKVHRAHIMEKTGARSVPELVLLAAGWQAQQLPAVTE